MIPTSIDALTRDSRERVERLRKLYGNPEDFEHVIRGNLQAMLTDAGYGRATIKLTMQAIFGDERS